MPVYHVHLFSDGAVRLFNTHIKSILRQPSYTLTDSFIHRAALLNTWCSTDCLVQSGARTGRNLKPQPACLD